MQLMAIGEETNLITGTMTFYLVFDDGKVRVPVSEEALRSILQTLKSPSPNGATPKAVPNGEAALTAPDEVVDEEYDPMSDQI
jgi:hypothetical protein